MVMGGIFMTFMIEISADLISWHPKNSEKIFIYLLHFAQARLSWVQFSTKILIFFMNGFKQRYYKFYLVSFETFQSQTKYFEPLTGSKSDREEILKEAFTCQVPRNRKDNLNDSFHLRQTTVGHWHGSETLCSPPFCQEAKMWCSNKCADPFKTEEGKKMLVDFCEEKKGVVIKEFRLDKPEQLYTLVDDTSVNLKIIRLIRDPRSMLVSRNGYNQIVS
jgi:hypothetical protein